MAEIVRLTNYGFRFGPALVDRLANHKGYVIVGIKTAKQKLDLTITPTGLIRVGKLVRNLEKPMSGKA